MLISYQIAYFLKCTRCISSYSVEGFERLGQEGKKIPQIPHNPKGIAARPIIPLWRCPSAGGNQREEAIIAGMDTRWLAERVEEIEAFLEAWIECTEEDLRSVVAPLEWKTYLLLKSGKRSETQSTERKNLSVLWVSERFLVSPAVIEIRE